MMANSTSRSASQRILAPTSRTEVTPREVGQLATRAGRSIPPTIRSCRREMAMSAPVFPAETAAWACLACTHSTAFHIELPLPRLMAWAGLASEEMTLVEGRVSLAAATAGCARRHSPTSASSPWITNLDPAGADLSTWARAGTITFGP